MRKVLVAGVICAALTLNGCTIVVNDLRHSGGYAGHVLDQRMFDASSSKQLQVLRAALVVAMVARAGTVYSRDGAEGDAYVSSLVDATDELNILLGYLGRNDKGLAVATDTIISGYGCTLPHVGPSSGKPDDNSLQQMQSAATEASNAASNALASASRAEAAALEAENSAQSAATVVRQAQAAAQVPAPASSPTPDALPTLKTLDKQEAGCLTYRANFESDLPIIEKKIFRLTVLALPQGAAKRFLSTLKSGNVLSAAIDGARLVFAAADGLHSAAAVQRTGLEVQSGLKSGSECGNSDSIDDLAAKCLGLSMGKIFTPDKVSNLSQRVPDVYFKAVFANVQASCMMIHIDAASAFNNKDLINKQNDRIKQCNKIKFKPRARFE